VSLVGGDCTRGPLTVSVQVHGFVPQGQALRRAGAQAGDLVYVTGTLGDAGLALLALRRQVVLPQAARTAVLGRLHRPAARVAAGRALRGIASAAIDVSDGLAADLSHILAASCVGATLYLERLPVSAVLRERLAQVGGWELPLTAGDDYELCFTVPEARQAAAEAALRAIGCPCAWLGLVERRQGLRCVAEDGSVSERTGAGYRHF
jgi:thiamine-monophosphate kinase